MSRREKGERGYVLVEAMVAAAVIATMTAVTYQAIATDATVASGLQQRREAVLVARSALDRATSAEADRSPESGGRAGALRWQVVREPYGEGGARDSGPRLERVAVRVTDAESGRAVFALQTLRLAR